MVSQTTIALQRQHHQICRLYTE